MDRYSTANAGFRAALDLDRFGFRQELMSTCWLPPAPANRVVLGFAAVCVYLLPFDSL